MTSIATGFFQAWVERELRPRVMASDACPSPLSMLVELRASAAEAGITDEELRNGVGDLCEAIGESMLRILDTVTLAGTSAQEDLANFPATPGAAMQIAISYLDGIRDVAGSDIETAADLVLACLARQGFRLTRQNGSASLESSQVSSRGRVTATQ